MTRKILAWTGMSILCLTLSGCLTLGPQTKTRYVISREGDALLIVENKTVVGVPLKDPSLGEVKRDIGGWVTMPLTHWERVKDALTEYRAMKAKGK